MYQSSIKFKILIIIIHQNHKNSIIHYLLTHSFLAANVWLKPRIACESLELRRTPRPSPWWADPANKNVRIYFPTLRAARLLARLRIQVSMDQASHTLAEATSSHTAACLTS